MTSNRLRLCSFVLLSVSKGLEPWRHQQGAVLLKGAYCRSSMSITLAPHRGQDLSAIGANIWPHLGHNAMSNGPSGRGRRVFEPLSLRTDVRTYAPPSRFNVRSARSPRHRSQTRLGLG